MVAQRHRIRACASQCTPSSVRPSMHSTSPPQGSSKLRDQTSCQLHPLSAHLLGAILSNPVRCVISNKQRSSANRHHPLKRGLTFLYPAFPFAFLRFYSLAFEVFDRLPVKKKHRDQQIQTIRIARHYIKQAEEARKEAHLMNMLNAVGFLFCFSVRTFACFPLGSLSAAPFV